VCAMPNLSDTYGVYNIFNGVCHIFNHRLSGKWPTNQKSVCFWEGKCDAKMTHRQSCKNRAKNEQISICKLSTGQEYSETVNETDRTQQLQSTRRQIMTPATSQYHAIVLGGSMAGLLAAARFRSRRAARDHRSGSARAFLVPASKPSPQPWPTVKPSTNATAASPPTPRPSARSWATRPPTSTRTSTIASTGLKPSVRRSARIKRAGMKVSSRTCC